MPTAGDLITLVRDTLDETTAGQWTNDMLVRWLNEAGRDLARSTRHLKGSVTIVTIDGTSEYALPASTIAVEHAYYAPDNDDRVMPLVARHYEGMDQVWGQFQNQTSTYPQWFTVIGMSPAAILKLYPTPTSDTDEVRLIVSKIPAELTVPYNAAETADAPNLWFDALTDYCEAKALRRDRDPRWQEAMELYAGKRDGLMNNTDHLAVNREVVPTPGGSYIDAWLVEPEWWD